MVAGGDGPGRHRAHVQRGEAPPPDGL